MNDFEMLVFKGKLNLEHDLAMKKNEQSLCSRLLAPLKLLSDALSSGEMSKVRKLAKEWDFPKSVPIDISPKRKTSHGSLLVPDLKRMNDLKPNSTTLNMCGWCAFCKQTRTTPGSKCRPRGDCLILPDITGPKNFPFYSPCFLTHASESLFIYCEEQVLKLIAECEKKEADLKEEIAQIKAAIAVADEKAPISPGSRSEFMSDDVMCFVFNSMRYKLIDPSMEETYVRAHIVEMKANSNELKVRFSEPIFTCVSNDSHNGEEIDCAFYDKHSPEIMTVEEYTYLRKHTGYLSKVWMPRHINANEMTMAIETQP